MFVYAIAYEGARGQFVLLLALPVVVLAVLLYLQLPRRRRTDEFARLHSSQPASTIGGTDHRHERTQRWRH